MLQNPHIEKKLLPHTEMERPLKRAEVIPASHDIFLVVNTHEWQNLGSFTLILFQ
jgi:hypothetical protein